MLKGGEFIVTKTDIRRFNRRLQRLARASFGGSAYLQAISDLTMASITTKDFNTYHTEVKVRRGVPKPLSIQVLQISTTNLNNPQLQPLLEHLTNKKIISVKEFKEQLKRVKEQYDWINPATGEITPQPIKISEVAKELNEYVSAMQNFNSIKEMYYYLTKVEQPTGQPLHEESAIFNEIMTKKNKSYEDMLAVIRELSTNYPEIYAQIQNNHYTGVF